jgi:hypothetical protein
MEGTGWEKWEVEVRPDAEPKGRARAVQLCRACRGEDGKQVSGQEYDIQEAEVGGHLEFAAS